ncbi:hypothetical protein Bca101_001245 [Brassica carinata]
MQFFQTHNDHHILLYRTMFYVIRIRSIDFATMDYDLVRSKKSIKRAESTKSHLWWWDSHVGLKNSKWLENNLDEMDKSVKRMVKLIEEDADSFAKKAEMYYQKRPELISLVDEFHRMYRSLAERYENITGELRKTSPLELLQSQGSGFSDVSSSDLTTEINRLGRPPSRRAPGFDYFLGSGGLPSDDSASVTDSELESDDSSVINCPGYVSVGSDFQSLSKRVADLETELREAKERLRMRDACEDQIFMLKSQLARYLPSELDDEEAAAASTQAMDVETLSEELRVTSLRLRDAEKENSNMRKEVEKLKSLQSLLDSAQKETAAWKSKSSADRREVVKKMEEEERMKGEIEVLAMEKAEKERCIETLTKRVNEIESEMSRLGDEMKQKDSRRIEMEKELEEVAEEKREVIRQLCFSLDYCKDECKRLRDAFSGDQPIRPSSILAS